MGMIQKHTEKEKSEHTVLSTKLDNRWMLHEQRYLKY